MAWDEIDYTKGGWQGTTYISPVLAERIRLAKEQEEYAKKQDAREEELYNKQMQEMGKAGQVAADWADQFFNTWNESRGKAEGVYNSAIESIQSARGDATTGYDDILGQINADYDQWKTDWMPLQAEMRDHARAGMAAETELMNRFMDNSAYDQGVAGRAKADVGSEFERMRRARALELQGQGMGMESGRYQGDMRKSRISEAIGKVLAANQARLAEKDRVANRAVEGMNAIDPNASINTANSIGSEQTRFLDLLRTTQGDKTSALNQLANTEIDAASQYSQNITAPAFEGFGTMFGTALQNNPNAIKTDPGAMRGPSGGGTGGTTAAQPAKTPQNYNFTFADVVDPKTGKVTDLAKDWVGHGNGQLAPHMFMNQDNLVRNYAGSSGGAQTSRYDSSKAVQDLYRKMAQKKAGMATKGDDYSPYGRPEASNQFYGRPESSNQFYG